MSAFNPYQIPITSSGSTYQDANLSSHVPVAVQYTPKNYHFDPTTGIYTVQMKEALKSSLINLQRLEMIPEFPTITDSTYTGLITYNSSNYNFQLPVGQSLSVAGVAKFLYSFQTQNNLYLVNSQGQNIVFIQTAVDPADMLTQIVLNPVPSSLPTGFTNPGGLALTGNTMTITLSASLAALLGGFITTAMPATAQTTSQVFESTSNATNTFFNYSFVPIGPAIQALYYPRKGRPSLYSGITAYGSNPIKVEPRRPSWYKYGNSGSENVLQFYIANEATNLPIVLKNPNIVFALEHVFINNQQNN